MLNVLSIDVEDYFQVHAFETVIKRSEWDRYPCRVLENTRLILRLLSRQGCHATFFVLGWVADRYPVLVQEILAGGHEIGTHGYWHELVYRQTPAEFAKDLRASLDAIQRAAGDVKIFGYRAPGFSITADSLWALEIVRDHGLTYDSSIFPLALHDRYGIRSAKRFASRLSNGLWEVPVSTVSVVRQNLPVAGGGYFRLYPAMLTTAAIGRINRQGEPAVVYLHPWEFDPAQPRVRGAPWLSRFRHYVNLGKTETRLAQLMQQCAFGSMIEVFGDRFADDMGVWPEPAAVSHRKL